MQVVTTISYKSIVNGAYTKGMNAKRGMRQGDPISLMLFVLVMEYLHRKLKDLSRIPNFNFHSKCEKLKLVDMSFDDDRLLFTRGDVISVQLVMDRFKSFFEATGLVVNPNKCKLYCGNIDDGTVQQITNITGLTSGVLPFSYAGRIRLINSVIFSTTNFWLQCIPLPKDVIRRIEALCRTFLWTGKGIMSRKALIAWSKVCEPKSQGGLNVVDLARWNKVCLIKLLWNLCRKADSLWVRWVHTNYMKDERVMVVPIKNSCSWILKEILKTIQEVEGLNQWQQVVKNDVFKTKKFYYSLVEAKSKVPWRKLMYENEASPRALFTLWMSCNKRIGTKDRLSKFGMISEENCEFCPAKESLQHLFFECTTMKTIWTAVLEWMNILHSPQGWDKEMTWLLTSCNKKGWRSTVLKTAFTETVYMCWLYRNTSVYKNTGARSNDISGIENDVIDRIVHRCWRNPKLREHVAPLLI
ncbi:uncharacterized protein LOC131623068 [Vicia villosa]|uniref:uncharacterized protein LOC131623068 n=1 Tax=Vicia villosa TaxID=3911 RepID=UPI00273A7679|nr:uncharacterized protein LOC131623068 [Vicia villosa]